MSRAYIVDPLAFVGFKYGYRRPLDRHDFPHGKVPGWAGKFIPGVGEMVRFANVNLGYEGPAAGVDTYTFTSAQVHPLGTVAITKEGRVFRYCQAGGADLVVGNLIQGPAPIANHLANTPPAVPIGATSFLYTPGATAGAANLYAEGTLMVDTTPGNGYTYRISGHPAIVSATAFNLTLDPDEAIQVALTSSSRVGLHHNPWKQVIQNPTTQTGLTAGFAVAPITTLFYGWLLTRGPVAALINGTPGVGISVVPGATTAGSVDVGAVAAEVNTRTIGHMMQVGVNAKNNAVYAQID